MTIPARIATLLTEDELAEEESLRQEELDRRWPKPEPGEIHARIEQLRAEFDPVHEKMRATRDRLTNDATMPANLRRHMVTQVNYHSRWSRNEVNRVTSIVTKNPPQFIRYPVGGTSDARARADRQERWLRARWQSVDRMQNNIWPLFQRVAYNQTEVGIGAIECFLTEAWGELVEEGFFDRDPEETPANRRRRMREMLTRTGLPWAWRQVEPTTLYWEAEEGPLSKAVIIEQKRYRDVYNSLRNRLSDEELTRRMQPLIGQYGHPLQNTATGDRFVETRRYYDPRWLGYEVAGHEMSVEEHGLPGVPVGICMGMPSGNPDKRFAFSGVTDGMGEQEQTADWLMSMLIDRTFVFGIPRPVIEREVGSDEPEDDEESPTDVVRLVSTDIDEVRVLPAGWKVRDAWAGMRSPIQEMLPVVQAVRADFQRSGMNPIAAGESPGADTAGFTVNALTASANTLYEPNMDQYARLCAWWADFELAIIRDTFGEETYVAAQGRGIDARTIKWIALGPKDIDPTHTDAKIDPLSDTNRLALRQTLAAAADRGIISPETEREQGYGIYDHEAEENAIVMGQVRREAINPLLVRTVGETIEITMQADQAMAEAEAQSAQDQNMAAQQGAVPAPIDQPTVGGPAAAMSRAGAPATRAGQFNNQFPPNSTQGGPF